MSTGQAPKRLSSTLQTRQSKGRSPTKPSTPWGSNGEKLYLSNMATAAGFAWVATVIASRANPTGA